jgi:hypothetical protein
MSEYGENTVIIHFVSTYRSHLAAFIDRCGPQSDPPVKIVSRPAGRVGPLGQLVSDIRARVGW